MGCFIKSNSEIADAARRVLSGQWNRVAGYVFGWLIVVFLGQLVIGGSFVLSCVFSVACMIGFDQFSLGVGRGYTPSWRMFWPFSGRIVGLLLANVVLLFLLGLGVLFFVIPGVWVLLTYGFSGYVALDHRDLTVRQVLARSKALVVGHRWQFFRLHCRWLGWGLLCLLTFGIASIWLLPYTKLQMVLFYEERKTEIPQA